MSIRSNPMRNKTKSGMLFAALLLTNFMSSAESLNVNLTGEAKPWCSPTDGQATRLEFPTTDGKILVFMLNTSIDQAFGNWSVGDGDRPKGLSASLCPKSYFPCEPFQSGKLQISSQSPGIWQGSWKLTLKSGEKVEHNFKAKLITTERHICG